MEVHRVSRDLWGIFKHYHYLTSSLATNSSCYVGFIENEPVAFVAMNRFPHPTNTKLVKVGRVVVLPHWQGYGIGMKMVEYLCENHYQGWDVRFTTTLPIVHSYLWKRKDKWGLKFQGIRRAEDAGTKASMSQDVRECYLETYQYKNELFVAGSPSRTRCPKDKVRV